MKYCRVTPAFRLWLRGCCHSQGGLRDVVLSRCWMCSTFNERKEALFCQQLSKATTLELCIARPICTLQVTGSYARVQTCREQFAFND
jgi:hypothetical protein